VEAEIPLIMFCLVDCNSFYASCEKVFRPDLGEKPVVVLSNNDGCVIARSSEAKAKGVAMGELYHTNKERYRKLGVKVFSSNYEFYGDMSSRVMEVLANFTPNLEVYSIDEAFMDLFNFYKLDLLEYSRDIKRTVERWTGLPVSLGLAPTKTLAKIANRMAKKIPANQGVYMLDTHEKIEEALKQTAITDVWGIGRRHGRRLQNIGVTTAWDFTRLSHAWVRKNMAVVGERTWRELQGQACLDLELEKEAHKNIGNAKSFPKNLKTFAAIQQKLSTYASFSVAKLHEERRAARKIMIFVCTNPHRQDLLQYTKNIVLRFGQATNDLFTINQYIKKGLRCIYRQGYEYKKAGIFLTDLVPDDQIQLSLLQQPNQIAKGKATKAMVAINNKFGKHTVTVGTQKDKEYKLRQEHRSKRRTTRFDELLIVS